MAIVMMKGKKILFIIVAVLSALMLVSAATAVPVSAGRPIRRLTRGLENFNRSILGDERYDRLRESLESRFPAILRKINRDNNTQQPLGANNSIVDRMRENNIRILGYENYTKIKENITSCFTAIQRKINSSSFDDFVAYWFDLLIEATITIFSFCYLLFGHNPIGDIIGIGTYLILMPIPVFILSLMESALYLPLIISLMTLGMCLDFEEIIYQFGLIGLILVMCVLLPITMTVGVVAIPVMTVAVFVKNYWFILSDTLAILWDE